MDEFLFLSSIVLWILINAALLALIIWAIIKFYKVLAGIRKSVIDIVEILRNKK